MEKNENGYPCSRLGRRAGAAPVFNAEVGGVTDNGQLNGNVGGMQENRPGNGCGSGSGNVGGEMNGGCGGGDSCIDEMEPAYVYAPSQKFRMLYSAADALAHGTLFEQLYKPREVYGRE